MTRKHTAEGMAFGVSRVEAPASAIVREAERFSSTVGHENRGFLSLDRGFVPMRDPLTRLSKDFAAWDQLAAELPSLYRTLKLRARVHDLPLLDASEQSLDNREALRACALLAMVSHAYWNVETKPPEALPAQLQLPWQQLRARLGRLQEVVTYIDLIVYNWRLHDPGAARPLTLENLSLLFPTVGTQEEQVFYLTQLEILAASSSIVRSALAAQDGVLQHAPDLVERGLVGVIEGLAELTGESLLKINPNPNSKSYVDPVVWAKTVAPFAVPIHAGDQGPSGTSSPIFNTLDTFFGRSRHESFLGREIQQLRSHYPPFWRDFLRSLKQVSIIDFVELVGRPSLSGALREAMELYAGETGFLGRHRMKVYGYLELAFKVGRSVTIGGFCGVFTDRTWDQVDAELVRSQKERFSHRSLACQTAQVKSVLPEAAGAGGSVRRVTLDVSESGARYHVGARCAVLPENSARLVDLTLEQLGATGDELLPLTDEWRSAMQLREEAADRNALTLHELLRFGCIRPVSARVAEALHAETQHPALFEHVQMGKTERWELWEVLSLLRADGFDPRRLWQLPNGGTSDRLAQLIPPERFRMYSVSSVSQHEENGPPSSVELTVGELRYTAEPTSWSTNSHGARSDDTAGKCPFPHRTPAAPPAVSDLEVDGAASGPVSLREGTASTFLSQAKANRSSVPFRLERSARFQLPRDPRTPIVLFAAGTGVAPYRAFIQQRARQQGTGPCLLFLSLRTPEEFLLAEEWRQPVASGLLELEVVFTRSDTRLMFDSERGLVQVAGARQRIDQVIAEPRIAEKLWNLLRTRAEGGQEASVYVCGRSSFATTVLETLKRVFLPFANGEQAQHERETAQLLYRLAGDNRLLLELHTDAKPISVDTRWIDWSELAEHNDSTRGYWMAIDQTVYDLTEFAELHPGGRRVIQAYAGIDATHGFARAHDRQPDVDAMREMYAIGRIRPLALEAFTAKTVSATGVERISCKSGYQAWVNALGLLVEMQNAQHVDWSLQESTTTLGEQASDETPYKLSRAFETHLRFLQSCLKPLTREPFPAVWNASRALFAPELPADWLVEQVRQVGRTPQATYVKEVSASLVDDSSRWRSRAIQLGPIAQAFREEDVRLLFELKQALLGGIRLFEQHEARTRQDAATQVIAACQTLPRRIDEYYRRLDLRLRQVCRNPSVAGAGASSQWPVANVRRLHDSEFWVLEEFPEQQLAVLVRTPLPAPTLAALAADNEALLGTLRDEHTQFGLVVDTRQAPMRNDKDFEQTMARLRQALTSHFQRSAVLLDSPLGELQAARLERDEQHGTLVTRSVSAAFRFAAGGR